MFAQPQLVPDPVFAVASVKASKAADFRREGIQFLPGGRLTATNYPLQVLIAGAYHLPYQSPRLVGGPDWVRSERFDIEAKADSVALPSGLAADVKRTRMRLMLQALLADRFHLTMRREVKELPVYALTVAKNGLRLPASKLGEEDCFYSSMELANQADSKPVSCHTLLGGQGFGLHGQAIDMSDLAVYLENFTDRPVVDETGVKGLFAIDTKGWVPLRGKPAPPGSKAEDGSDLDGMPSLFTILGEFGLKLEGRRAAVEIFTIDRVERLAEN
jgi:uncharacterized protein (TIGR03435 family)